MYHKDLMNHIINNNNRYCLKGSINCSIKIPDYDVILGTTYHRKKLLCWQCIWHCLPPSIDRCIV